MLKRWRFDKKSKILSKNSCNMLENVVL
jgi:hypothetical protein